MEQGTRSAEEAQKRFGQLPPEVQKMLYSEEMVEIIQKIGQKHELHIDQLDLLNAETGQVMLGFIEPKDFPEALTESLRIDSLKASAIAQDVNKLLFEKIRAGMRQAGGYISSTETVPVASPSITNIPSTPKPQFPAADVMLTQKTLTPLVPVPPRLGANISTPVVPEVSPKPLVPNPTPQRMQTMSISTPVVSPTLKPAFPPQNTSPTPAATASTPPTQPPQNPIYKTDPYREPPE